MGHVLGMGQGSVLPLWLGRPGRLGSGGSEGSATGRLGGIGARGHERLLPCGRRASLASAWQTCRRRPGPEPETKRGERAGLRQPEERSGRRGEGCAEAERGAGDGGPVSAPALHPRHARGRRCPAKPCRASCGHRTPPLPPREAPEEAGRALRGRFRLQCGPGGRGWGAPWVGPGCENLGRGVNKWGGARGLRWVRGRRGRETASGRTGASRRACTRAAFCPTPELRAISFMKYSPAALGAPALRKAWG